MLPSYLYHIEYDDRDPIDAVAFTKYKKEKNESSL